MEKFLFSILGQYAWYYITIGTVFVSYVVYIIIHDRRLLKKGIIRRRKQVGEQVSDFAKHVAPIIISIERIKLAGQDILNFETEVETRHYVKLIQELYKVGGIEKYEDLNNGSRVNQKSIYNFSLRKRKDANWEEIFPKVEDIFMAHFNGQVEFVGEYPIFQ